MAKKKTNSVFKNGVICVFALIVGFVVGFAGWGVYTLPNDSDKFISGDLKIHFLELGNGFTGDCVYIQVGEVDIIVDGGSRTNSSTTIYNYIQPLMNDDKIEFAIVTHADQDHIAGFAGDGSNQSLFEMFEFETIIDFPLSESTSATYQRYQDKRQAEVDAGAVHYTALQCFQNKDGAQSIYELAEGINLEILYNYYYENDASNENDYSVIFQITQWDSKFLFTGDLEENGEEKFVEYYGSQLTQVELYKAGHHGSKTRSNSVLLEKIQPKIVVATCSAGSVEYAGKDETPQLTLGSNAYKEFMSTTFPTQRFIDRVAEYTQEVYVTTECIVEYNTADGKYKDEGFKSMNGNIVVTSNKNGVEVEGSNNTTKLKDTEWFANNRKMPTEWA